MPTIDPEVRKQFGRAVLQCGLATLVILLIFLALDIIVGPALVASLGATSFIVFAMPNYPPAQPKRLIGGYLIGTLTGTGCSFLAGFLAQATDLGNEPLLVGLAAISIGLTMLAMVITETEHPPAAGLALGFVIEAWDYRTIAFVLAAAIMLALAKRLLCNVLIDLV